MVRFHMVFLKFSDRNRRQGRNIINFNATDCKNNFLYSLYCRRLNHNLYELEKRKFVIHLSEIFYILRISAGHLGLKVSLGELKARFEARQVTILQINKFNCLYKGQQNLPFRCFLH
jgi:hypothetical protein